MSGTASPERADEDAPFAGILTYASAQHGQEAVLWYAHKPATNGDVVHMIELLRWTADKLAEGLPS